MALSSTLTRFWHSIAALAILCPIMRCSANGLAQKTLHIDYLALNPDPSSLKLALW